MEKSVYIYILYMSYKLYLYVIKVFEMLSKVSDI